MEYSGKCFPPCIIQRIAEIMAKRRTAKAIRKVNGILFVSFLKNVSFKAYSFRSLYNRKQSTKDTYAVSV